MKSVFFVILATMVSFALPTRAADPPLMIEWEDLAPEGPEVETPLRDMDIDQLTDLEALIGIRDLEERGLINTVSPTYERGVELRAQLTEQGFDVDAMIAEYARLEEIALERSRQTVPMLDGKLIRIPGYALPLEFDGTAVKEFLLVPYVGACIHSPPPPSNQTLLVTLKDPYETESLFDPVWITGTVRIEVHTKSLTYVDGTSGVESAYTIEDVRVEPYTE